MKKNYLKFTLYVLLTALFSIFTYIFLYQGFNLQTKIYIQYQEKSSYNYDYILKENKIENIKIKYNYNNTFSENISGYYKYNIKLELLYNENNILTKKEYTLLNDNIKVINNNTNTINISDTIDLEYDYYKNIINNISKETTGNLKLIINIYNYVNFTSIKGDYPLENIIIFEIPFEENPQVLGNNINNKNKLSDFSTTQNANYLNIFIGLICLSLTISFLILVIKMYIFAYKKEQKYKQNIKEILKKHDNKIVNIKKFHNMKKYNIIYVDSLEELLELQKKYNTIINYSKVNRKAIFLIVNEKNAWIYIFKEK